MVRDEYFTIYKSSRTPVAAVNVDDDIEDGKFSDEEDINLIDGVDIVGKITDRSSPYNRNNEIHRLHVPFDTSIDVGDRVKRQATGTIYVVSSVIQTKVAGRNKIAQLNE